MSSPPTPTTSLKAAPLHTTARKHQRRSLSFPIVVTLNPFHRKPSDERTKPPSPVEPYEVAPGIWNTDATAKVFGYLDPFDKNTKYSSQSAGPDRRKPSEAVKRKPVAPGRSRDPRKEANADEVSSEFAPRVNEKYVELPDPHRRGEDRTDAVNRAPERDERKVQRNRMRTVSRDDRLVQRGANPRTGLVSPFINSDSSDDNIGHDYVTLGETQQDQPLPMARTRSGKWKQDGVGWSLVESPLLGPIAQSTTGQMSRQVSIKQLEDKLPAEMPGVDNREPENMSDKQMRKYQDSIARVYKHGGSTAMVVPCILPSPRELTPEGPSTPPKRLQRIRRKMVGRGPSPKEYSDATIIVNAQNQASSVLTPEKGSKEQLRVRIVTPSNTPIGSSFEHHLARRSTPPEDHFLGQHPKLTSVQARAVAHLPSLQDARNQEAYHGFKTEQQTPSKASFVSRSASPTLSQYLPCLHFIHPSHFANLGTSYRRSPQLLPTRLRPLEQQRKNIEDACTIITTSMLSPNLESDLRPKVQRQEGRSIVPRVKDYSPPTSVTSREKCLQGDVQMRKYSFAMKLPADTSNSNTARPIALTPKILVQDLSGAQNETRTPMLGAEQGARKAMLQGRPSQQVKELRPRKRSGANPVTQRLSLGSANVVRDLAQRSQRNGAGITHMCARRGDGENWSYWTLEHEGGSQVSSRAERQPLATMEIAFNGNGGVWFAGQWAEAVQDQGRLDSVGLEQKAALTWRLAIFRKAADVKLWLCVMEGWFQASTKLNCIQQRLYQMACHAISHIASYFACPEYPENTECEYSGLFKSGERCDSSACVWLGTPERLDGPAKGARDFNCAIVLGVASRENGACDRQMVRSRVNGNHSLHFP